MAPWFCYTHQGLYISSPPLEGCQDPGCVEFAKKEVPPAGVCVARFAGDTVTRNSRANSKQFHKDMDSYREAVRQGVSPDQVTAVAAEAALKAAEAKSDAK
ncbi:hypothetical protein LCGC14_1653780 [marine sediment metagenome]|uniref:Uncharacterized protein n=1 Tax=marine sediment metagenome TaxID=412755 RepID=A0A0F9IIP3_9ZZZZ